MPKLKKRADGRYVKTFTDPRTGKRKSFYGKTEREIDKKILEYHTGITNGRTFREVADDWWEEAEPELAVQSVRGYDVARRRAVEFFGDQLIREIAPRHISKYLESLGKQSLGYKTVAKAKLICNLIFKHGLVNGDLDINICADVPLPRGLAKSTRKAAEDEDERIIKEMAEDEWIVPFVALMTGLRKGEILALQWQDIDFDKGVISVTKSVAHDGNKPFVKSTKTEAGERLVPLLDPLRDRLQVIPDKKPEKYIVSVDGGKSPLTAKQYDTRYKAFKQRNNVSTTAHPLRHSFATLALENGIPIKSLQGILGHAQASTTINTYAHFRDKALYDAARILNNSEDFKKTKSDK